MIFDLCKKTLFENLENKENFSFFVVNAILTFFTNMDSIFIENNIIEFLIDFYNSNLDHKEFNKFVSLTGIIVC